MPALDLITKKAIKRVAKILSFWIKKDVQKFYEKLTKLQLVPL